MPRLRFFKLIREIDTFGVSGTGHIATGVLIQDENADVASTDGPVIFTFATSKMAQTTTITNMENIMKFQCGKVPTTYSDASKHGLPTSYIEWIPESEPQPVPSWPLEWLQKMTGPCVFYQNQDFGN